jgi:hypothetical protein
MRGAPAAGACRHDECEYIVEELRVIGVQAASHHSSSGKERACVLVLYIEGSNEDPRTQPGGDLFAEAISEVGRVHWLRWPSEMGAVARVVSETA